MNTATIIAELETERDQLATQLQTVDEVLASIRRLDETSPPLPEGKPTKRGGGSGKRKGQKVRAAKAPKAPRAAAEPKTRKSRAPVDDATLARAKQIAKESGLRAAADATGIKYGRLWKLSKDAGWKVASSPKGRSVAAPEKKAATKTLPNARHCPHCGATTTKDPCHLCGAPARKG